MEINIRDKKWSIEIKEKGKRFLLCSCGLSKNMPKCDSSHKKIKEE